MTVHPIELIAGMDDGMDLDQKDQVTGHIASCDACRTVARTMRRIDGLIAVPEPMLPLPKRATPRAGVRVAGWESVVAVSLALAVMVVLVLSFRQTQAAAIDACGVLAAAARSAGGGGATAKASRIELPSPLSESWTACAYGEGADRAGPWLLFRSRPTVGREVRGLLVAMTTDDPGKQLVFGKFTPALATDATEKWVTEESTRASGTGRAMAVLAEPYFFVVTAPSYADAERFADAVLTELRQRPWPTSAASKTDACSVIRRAASSAGLPAKGPNGSALTTNRHWTDLSIGNTSLFPYADFGDNICGFGADESWHDPHLVLRAEPTTLQRANDLLLILPDLPVDGWAQIEAGMWLARGRSSYSDCRGCPVRTKEFSAVAVSDAPHFFVVTQATDEAAIRLARAVLAELKRP